MHGFPVDYSNEGFPFPPVQPASWGVTSKTHSLQATSTLLMLDNFRECIKAIINTNNIRSPVQSTYCFPRDVIVVAYLNALIVTYFDCSEGAPYMLKRRYYSSPP